MIIFLPGLKVTGNDELQRWPCQSSHRIVVSLDDAKPLIVTLPYPILPDTLKATLRRKDGVVVVVAAKALHDIWPEDVIRDQFRWNPEKLEPWMDPNSIEGHFISQFPREVLANSSHDPDVLNGVRFLIASISKHSTNPVRDRTLFFELLNFDNVDDSIELLIRVHLPVRTSVLGAPVLLLSVLDHSQVADQTPQGLHKFKRILCHGDASKIFETHFVTADEVRLLRHILRFNSTKIQPTAWQKENLPRGGDSPWLATFIQPLYLDGPFNVEKHLAPSDSCSTCGKQQNAKMKKCGRCKRVSYCSVECQRVHWPQHKLSCENA